MERFMRNRHSCESGLDLARRRSLKLIATTAVALLAGIGMATAQSYPERPVRIVVPYAAGGPTDVIARVLAEGMTARIGQQVLVENKPGASGQIAVDAVAQAAPDGYTLLLTALGITTLPHTNVGFDPAILQKLEPISLIEQRAVVLAVSKQVPATNIQEFIVYAKANPGKLSYGAQGAPDILGIAQLGYMSGIELKTVRYQGGAPAMQAMLAGQIDATIVSLSQVKQYLDAGEVKAVAVTGPERMPALPDVPTISEAVPGFEYLAWTGISAPAGTSKEITAKLSQAMVETLKSEDVVKRFSDLGTTPKPSTSEEFAAFFQKELDRWAKVASDIGYKPQ